ncbi:MAG TPA: bifunctional riboflavin kinase/FAD synthetase [Chitinophagaceae bacterium]|nr:bifunctional riboflavin kinase/FAD synthetase [Chitinophagaceae bacterium]
MAFDSLVLLLFMQVHYDIDKLPAFRKAVITIGTFDGVHLGHQQVLASLKKEAARINGESVIITFHPHPRKVVSSAILGIRLINTLEEKITLLEALGIDHLVVVPFTDAFANQPAEDYVKNFLVEKFHPHTVIIGYDHRFGRERLGDYRLLEKLAAESKFKLKEIPKRILNEISISSTNIREAVLHNDMDTANKLLGHEFFFEGEVIHGNKLGRKLGYPTANLKIADEEKMIPGDGIYAVYASVKSEKVKANNNDIKNKYSLRYKGMMSIGFRPTVDGKKRVIEVNIFDFEKEIYGEILQVFVKKYLRAEAKFNTLEELISKIDQDKMESLKVL